MQENCIWCAKRRKIEIVVATKPQKIIKKQSCYKDTGGLHAWSFIPWMIIIQWENYVVDFFFRGFIKRSRHLIWHFFWYILSKPRRWPLHRIEKLDENVSFLQGIFARHASKEINENIRTRSRTNNIVDN